jgi:alkylhydroperoxidase family enzyme
MSTNPRVSSAVPGTEPDFATALLHTPGLAQAFGALYGTLWSHGVVSQSIKETVRMRNARVTDCGFCKNVRFAAARDEGLTEDAVSLIHDGYDRSALTDAQKAALRFTDAYLTEPAGVSESVTGDMARYFSSAEIVEIALALSLFMGMAKVLISLGMEPEQLDTTVVPTPDVVAV